MFEFHGKNIHFHWTNWFQFHDNENNLFPMRKPIIRWQSSIQLSNYLTGKTNQDAKLNSCKSKISENRRWNISTKKNLFKNVYYLDNMDCIVEIFFFHVHKAWENLMVHDK